MIIANEVILSARIRLGEPVSTVELSDEQMSSLLLDARDAFYLFVEFSNLTKEEIETIADLWIKKYFFANCKESLGRVRGKFSGNTPVPGLENMKLDYESLLSESAKEKKFLKYLLLKDKNILNDSSDVVLVFYVYIGDRSGQEIAEYIGNIKNQLKGNDSFIKYFIPIKDGETRVECIHPIRSNTMGDEDSEVIKVLNDYLKKLIDEK